MIFLWVAAGLMILGALGGVFWPFLKKGQKSAPPDRVEYDLAVYKDQLAEVSRDLERGLMNESRAEAARVEIKRRILACAGADALENQAKGLPAGVTRWVGLVCIVMIPLGAIGLYLQLGSPTFRDHPLAERNLEEERASQERAEIDRLVKGLTARLKQDPKNTRGWVLLGNTYVAADRYAQAVLAYRRALKLAGRRPDILSSLGEALVLEAQGRLTDKSRAILVEANDKNPMDPRPYFYLASDLADKGDLRGAIQHWVNLGVVSQPDAPWRGTIRRWIQVASARLGIKPGSITPTVKAPAADKAQTANPAP